MVDILRSTRHLTLLMGMALMAFFMASGTSWLLAIPLTSGLDPNGLPAFVPVRPGGDEFPTFVDRSSDLICQHNVFDTTDRPCDGSADPPPPGPEAGTEVLACPRGAQLVGTISSEIGSQSLAFIRLNGELALASLGQEVEGLGRVEQIGWHRVLVVMNQSSKCLLDLYSDPTTLSDRSVSSSGDTDPPQLMSVPLDEISREIEVVSATERRVGRDLIRRVMSSPREVIGSVRVLPVHTAEGMQGFRLYGIGSGSPLDRLGLQNGDVVTEINGIEMNSVDRPIMAYTRLRNESSLTVSYLRRGRTGQISVEIQ
jgi:general secretion pathway protein C